MNIDFYILLRWLSVTFTRSGFAMFLKPISDVFSNLYASIKNWQKDIVLQSAITCQVMYMELIINYRIFGNYNRTIYITDGDQVTVDFVVNVPAGVNYNVQLLIGLLEKYKATGKRYTIEQTQLVYQVSWVDFVCEQVNRTYDVSWIDFVCEKEEIQDMQYNALNVYYYDNELTIISDLPTVSAIDVRLLINNASNISVVIPIESAGYEAFGEEITSVEFVSISPSEDADYWYIAGDISHSLPPNL